MSDNGVDTSLCSSRLTREGKPTPRTCSICGLGPCAIPESVGATWPPAVAEAEVWGPGITIMDEGDTKLPPLRSFPVGNDSLPIYLLKMTRADIRMIDELLETADRLRWPSDASRIALAYREETGNPDPGASFVHLTHLRRRVHEARAKGDGLSPDLTEHANLINEVLVMLDYANKHHGPYNSAHEAYGVLAEEVHEFFEIVMQKQAKRDMAHMRKELIDVAVVALRSIIDICDKNVRR